MRGRPASEEDQMLDTESPTRTDVAVGEVVGIYLAPDATEPTRGVEAVEAIAGRGLEGDRYFHRRGTYSHTEPPTGRQITLIEAEALEGLAREDGVELAPNEARRNVVTRGIGLNELVGKRFRIGSVECVGVRLCPPCAHLERLTRPGVNRGLVNRGGLRADILTGGRIAVGDAVTADQAPS
jgi:MOSC domain-containing protein YiiM